MVSSPVTRREFLGAAAVASFALPPLAAAADALESKPVLVHTKELLRQRAGDGAAGSHVWTLHKTDKSRTNLVEMRGEVGLHLHPDAAHSLYVIQGEVAVTAGDLKTTLMPGDYISIPAGMPHKYVVAPDAPALLISMDAPPYDAAKTVRL